MIKDLEDFKTYNFAMELGEEVWGIVIKWNYFEKDTIGKQLVKAVDSIAANLSEGLGRYHYKEAKNFSFYARGSLFETQTWITKAYNRKLMEEKQFVKIKTDLDIVGRMINKYIKSIGTSKRPDETDENTSPDT
jgi:four helix bundle protein